MDSGIGTSSQRDDVDPRFLRSRKLTAKKNFLLATRLGDCWPCEDVSRNGPRPPSALRSFWATLASVQLPDHSLPVSIITFHCPWRRAYTAAYFPLTTFEAAEPEGVSVIL